MTEARDYGIPLNFSVDPDIILLYLDTFTNAPHGVEVLFLHLFSNGWSEHHL
jgi:hypothetical protein